MRRRVPASRLATKRRNSIAVRSRQVLIENLALELYGVVHETLCKFGITTAHQKRLAKRRWKKVLGTPTSNEVLRQFTELGNLVAAWNSDAKYLDVQGKPRILDIEGAGPTFSSLAKRFLPTMSTIDAVKFACNVAEVGTLRDGKIALLGSTLVNISCNLETALAQSIYHIACLSQTCAHNYRSRKSKVQRGRIERITGRVISVDRFDEFQTQIRPQIHDLCEKVEGMLRPMEHQSARTRGSKAAVGMGIYLYSDQLISVSRRKSRIRPAS
jgi:hypothetical protein